MPKVIIKHKACVFDDVFRVEEAKVSFEHSDGTMSPVVRRLNLDRGDSVAALLYHRERQRLLLVKQFRFPTHEKGPGWTTEIVAGMVDPGEDFEQAIRREVMEEVGYELHDTHHVSTFYVSPGGTSERVGLFFAKVGESAKIGSGGGVSDEDVETIELSVDEAFAQIARGEIVDAKTIVGILWLRNSQLALVSEINRS